MADLKLVRDLKDINRISIYKASVKAKTIKRSQLINDTGQCKIKKVLCIYSDQDISHDSDIYMRNTFARHIFTLVLSINQNKLPGYSCIDFLQEIL